MSALMFVWKLNFTFWKETWVHSGCAFIVFHSALNAFVINPHMTFKGSFYYIIYVITYLQVYAALYLDSKERNNFERYEYE